MLIGLFCSSKRVTALCTYEHFPKIRIKASFKLTRLLDAFGDSQKRIFLIKNSLLPPLKTPCRARETGETIRGSKITKQYYLLE